MLRLSILAAALAVAAFPNAAGAITCYTVVDQQDTTIYQDTEPPFDLSTEGGPAARASLRAKHEFLNISDADRCPQISAPPGATGYQPASVDDIVAAIRPYAAAGTGTVTSAARGGGRAAAPAPASRGSSRKY
ncbi:MAG TPA: hypothetical protein VL742_16415 [Casimicrobiaceae bacterium]|nr:hypothetical protein [Casimicrobiaceae bacterium]